MTNSPIGVALIGLSAKNPHAWANTTHLPALLHHPSFRITALINSTVASAEEAIKAYNLPPSTKAYGDVSEAVKDPNVQLVAVSVNVERHYELTKPALEAGKDVYVEWPLAANVKEAKELTDLAKAKGVKVVVGLQGRANPVVATLKEIIESGRIGQVLNSTLVGRSEMFEPGKPLPQFYEYLLRKETGGNTLTIPFGHLFDNVLNVLGPLQSYQSLTTTNYGPVSILSPTGGEPTTVQRTAADQVAVIGRLASGGILSATFRAGSSSDKPLRWSIFGTKAEIEVTGKPFISIYPGDVAVRIRNLDSGEVEEVPIKAVEGLPKELAGPAIDVYGVYDAFVKGDKTKFADFEDALRHHELLTNLEEGSEKGVQKV